MAKVFISYCHADEEMRNQLEMHLSLLKRQGVVETWHDRRIIAGQNIDSAISQNLEQADVVLLLISPNFLDSDYCYDREMKRAMERHEAGEAAIIPVILRMCDWHSAPFGQLNATPPDGRPIRLATDQDQAFFEVAKAIRLAVANLEKSQASADLPISEKGSGAGAAATEFGEESEPDAEMRADDELARWKVREQEVTKLVRILRASLELKAEGRRLVERLETSIVSDWGAVNLEVDDFGKAVNAIRSEISLGPDEGFCKPYFNGRRPGHIPETDEERLDMEIKSNCGYLRRGIKMLEDLEMRLVQFPAFDG